MVRWRNSELGGKMYSFDTFQLIPGRRLLLDADRPVALGGRAFDILALLLERAGEVVEKDELIARAWPKACVEEANLRVHVSALRKALGEGRQKPRFIASIAGRGYSFVAPVELTSDLIHDCAPIVAPTVLPRPSYQVLGRNDAIAAVAACLGSQRLISTFGPGGMEKTTVALSVAERTLSNYPDPPCLVDMTPLSNPALIPGALAAALRVPISLGDPMASILLHLRDRRVLLILDNCDHVIDAVTKLVEHLLEERPA